MTEAEYQQRIRDRIKVQERAVEAANDMLNVPVRDFAHLMQRMALRRTIDRAEQNIQRLKGKL